MIAFPVASSASAAVSSCARAAPGNASTDKAAPDRKIPRTKPDVPAWYDALKAAARWDVQARFWRAVAGVCKDSPAVFECIAGRINSHNPED